MPLTVSSKRLPDAQPWSSDQLGRRTYTEVFEVDQTDAGDLASGVAVAIAAQQVLTGDPVPLRGENYSYGGTTDLDAFALTFSGVRPRPVDFPKRWHITVTYGQPEVNSDALVEDDPLLWPPEYWVEWTEESVPLVEGRIVEDLSHVGLSPGTLTPLTNSAGQQTIDPQMKTVFYPVLCCQKAYATLEEIVALNTTYQDSTNNGVFFGAAPRTARYLLTESGRVQRAGQQAVYFGVTRIWFKAETWDRKILNNGWLHLKKNGDNYLVDKEGNDPGLWRYKVQEITYDQAGQPVKGDFVDSPEPANLNLDGTPKLNSEHAESISYRYLNELNYLGIGVGG
jgi:hypothetical protein